MKIASISEDKNIEKRVAITPETAKKYIDNVPEEVKRKRANEIMEIQSGISWKLNRDKIGKEFNVIIDRKSGNYYLGRTEFDSPDVDNEVLIDAKKFYLKTGEFVSVKIVKAYDFDLHGVPVSL